MKLIVALLLAPSAAFAHTSYVVREGDTILKISDRTLGWKGDKRDPRRYPFARAIIAANPGLTNPDVISPGQTLVLPDHERQPSANEPATPVVTLIPQPETAKPAEVAPPAPVVETPAPPPAPAVPPPPPSAPAPAAPTEHTEVAEHHESEGRFLLVQPRAQFTSYKVKSEEFERDFHVNANPIAGLALTYGHALGGDLHLLLQAGADYVHLQNPSGEEAPVLDRRTQWLKNLAVGLEWHATHALKVELLGFYRDRLFVMPIDADNFEVRNVAVPGAELALKWSFFHLAHSEFGLGIAGEYLGSASKDGVTYKACVDPVGSLFWESNAGYGVTVYDAPNSQHSEGMEQEVQTIGVDLHWRFEF